MSITKTKQNLSNLRVKDISLYSNIVDKIRQKIEIKAIKR